MKYYLIYIDGNFSSLADMVTNRFGTYNVTVKDNTQTIIFNVLDPNMYQELLGMMDKAGGEGILFKAANEIVEKICTEEYSSIPELVLHD